MDKIPLSEMLAQLRKELVQAQWEGEDSNLKFLIEDIEIELQIATTKGADGGGGVQFWVYNAEAQVDVSEAKPQTLKCKLKPVEMDENPTKLSDQNKRSSYRASIP